MINSKEDKSYYEYYIEYYILGNLEEVFNRVDNKIINIDIEDRIKICKKLDTIKQEIILRR